MKLGREDKVLLIFLGISVIFLSIFFYFLLNNKNSQTTSFQEKNNVLEENIINSNVAEIEQSSNFENTTNQVETSNTSSISQNATPASFSNNSIQPSLTNNISSEKSNTISSPDTNSEMVWVRRYRNKISSSVL